MPGASLSWGGLDVQILLELTFVLHRDIEGQDHRHADTDLPAFQGIDRRIGLLIQASTFGYGKSSVGVGLVNRSSCPQRSTCTRRRLEPIAGCPARAILADLPGDRALLLTALSICVGVGQLDLGQGARRRPRR